MEEENKDEIYNALLKQLYEEVHEEFKQMEREKPELNQVYLDIIKKYKK